MRLLLRIKLWLSSRELDKMGKLHRDGFAWVMVATYLDRTDASVIHKLINGDELDEFAVNKLPHHNEFVNNPHFISGAKHARKMINERLVGRLKEP